MLHLGLCAHRTSWHESSKSGLSICLYWPNYLTLCLWGNHVKKLIQVFPWPYHIDCENNCPTDRFAAVQPVWGLFNSNIGKYVAPSEYLTIDEILYPM